MEIDGDNMEYYSPLRYPGGKGKLSNYIKKIIELNNLHDGIYIEPFAGGGGVALSLLFTEFMSSVIINDLSKPIYAFWYSVLNYTDDLCNLIYNTPVTVEEWNKQRLVQGNIDNCSTLELGFSTYFLNRTNRSGILTGGIIGGINQEGKWKLDARFNKQNLVMRIEKIALYKDRIQIYNLDAVEFINNIIKDLDRKAFVYLDPPYYKKGQDLYENYYNHSDHVTLSKTITNAIKHNWIITYDNTFEICNMYKKYRQIVYSLSYSAATRYRGSEIMIFCNKLNIPEFDHPTPQLL